MQDGNAGGAAVSASSLPPEPQKKTVTWSSILKRYFGGLLVYAVILIVIDISPVTKIFAFALAIFLAVYLLPSAFAAVRDHAQLTQLIILNVALGWTFIGWVACLVWAFRRPSEVIVITAPPQAESLSAADSMPCPRCAETIKRAAKVCRFCGHDLASGVSG